MPATPPEKPAPSNASGDISPQPGHSPRPIHGWKWAIAYTSTLSTTLLFALDNTITADIQPAILHTFSNAALLPWIGTAFALGSMCILPWGRIYGVFDIKWVYLFNILLFEAGSAICGAAGSMEALIVGRVMAGVGGSGMYAGTLTYVSVLTGEAGRPAYLAGSTVVWGVGSVLGPVVGGAFADSAASWRWGFYINLVIGALFAPAYLLLFPSIQPRPNTTFCQRLTMVDWLAALVFLAGAACLVLAITFGGIMYAFDSSPMIALWTVTGVLLVVMVLLTRFHPGVARAHRLYPAHFFKEPVLLNMQVQVFMASGIILAMTYYVPLYFQFAGGDGYLEAGVRLLPLIIFMVVVSMLNGVLMPRFPHYGPWHIGGSALALVGCGLMCSVTSSTPAASVYGYEILVGAGTGAYVVAGFGIVQTLVPATEVSTAIGAMTIAQDLGMVLFLAIAGSMYQNIALQRLTNVLPRVPADEISQLIAGATSSAYLRLSPEEQEAVIPAIVSSLKNIWILFTAAAAVSFVLAVPLARKRLGGPMASGSSA